MRILTISSFLLLGLTGCMTQADGTFVIPSDCDTGEDCDTGDDDQDDDDRDTDDGGSDDDDQDDTGNGNSGSGSTYNSVARFVAPSEAASMWCHVGTSDDYDAFMDSSTWPPYTAHGMVHWSNTVEIEFNSVAGAEVAWANCTVCPFDELDEEPYGAGDGGNAEDMGCYWFGYGSDPDGASYELGSSRIQVEDHWYYDTDLLTRDGQTAVVFELF